MRFNSTALAQVGLPADVGQNNHRLSYLIANLDARPLSDSQTHGDQDHLQGTASNSGQTDDVTTSLPKVEVRASPGRGLGLFAVDRIPAYTKILEDDALLSLAQGEDLPQLWSKYCLLSPQLKRVFDSLSFPVNQVTKEEGLISKLKRRGYSDDEAKEMARVSLRFQGNAFKTPSAGAVNVGRRLQTERQAWAVALFANIARVNHSCAPNAHAHYRPSSGAELLYALRDIELGDEIEISYFDMTLDRENRQARATSWGFQCSCPVCSFPVPVVDYEERLALVHQYLSSDRVTELEHQAAIDNTKDAIYVASSSDCPWLVAALPKLYLNLARLQQKAHRPRSEVRESMDTYTAWESKITGYATAHHV